MEIRLEWPGTPAHRLTVTMRTPGHDFELAAGLLLGDGLVRAEQVARIAYCTDETLSPEEQFNVVTVTLAQPPVRDPAGRYGARSSACGVCGSQSLDQVLEFGGTPVSDKLSIDPDVVSALPEQLAARQSLFARTGGLHGAGLFRADGELVVVREDVGRHNAVDKVVGARALRGTSAAGTLLCVSGRVGFEICQKAVMAAIPVVVAVGAPSSLAVACAERFGVTVAGFTRDERFVVYAGEQRLGV